MPRARGQNESPKQNVANSPDKVAPPNTQKYTASNYKTPISFEPNIGQFDSMVKYRSYGLGYNLFLTSDDVVIVFNKPLPSNSKEKKNFLDLKSKLFEKTERSVLRMKFVGANSSPKISAREVLPGKRNYLSAKHKITDVSNYGKVVYDNLYDGVNLTFYSNQKSLEYDFEIAPKTDFSKVRLKFEGAEKINLSPEGDLILKAGGEEIRHKKPVIYQIIAGTRKIVEAEFLQYDLEFP